MSDIVAAGVRTGLGAHTLPEAQHSMRWHRDNQLWLDQQAMGYALAARAGGNRLPKRRRT